MNRRGFLTGMAGILAAGYSASVLPSGVIMPIRKVWVPEQAVWRYGVDPAFGDSVTVWECWTLADGGGYNIQHGVGDHVLRTDWAAQPFILVPRP